MNAIKYIQEKGIKQTFHVIYQYKLDIVIQKVLKDIIVI